MLTHGFVVDAQGRKMSKSQGNVISPLDLMKTMGADILRLWTVSADYTEDLRIGDEILAGQADGGTEGQQQQKPPPDRPTPRPIDARNCGPHRSA